MRQKKLIIKNKIGLHTRSASILVQQANKFNSDISILHQGKEADAKSILGVISLGAEQGSEIMLKVTGQDEEAAFVQLSNLINLGLEQEE